MTAEKKQAMIDTCKANITQNEETLHKLQDSLQKNQEFQTLAISRLPEGDNLLDQASVNIERIENLIEQVEDLLISSAENLRNIRELEVDE
jgi:hypothetical protein